ncbi:MAG TPA: hypothetical protein VLT32_17810 [Candidatus Sulfomarinibacteraceae bacterium]|nr:hypothetical protein [Candidatus Sulfomarinibacteraceae bacterium]
MKDAIQLILGKRISGVVVKREIREGYGPRQQVFLVFDDETHFEFYGDRIQCTGGVDRGGMDYVRGYMSGNHEIELEYSLPRS